MIKTRNIDPAAAARYVNLEWSGVLPALGAGTTTGWIIAPYGYDANALKQQAVVPGLARVVDVVMAQSTAGTAGTSWTANVKKNGTTVFATNGVLALASGANVAIDTKAELALPTGATRPVLLAAPNATLLTKKGDVWSWDLTVTGTYTGAGPQVSLLVIIDPTVV